MPRLGSFVVCEKIILDQQGKPTLVSLFQTLTALIAEEQQIPKDTLGGTPWSVFCEWFFDESEFDKSFEQVIEVLLPDGSPAPIRGRLPLKEVAKDGHGTRAYVNMFGMPIAQTGFVTVAVWLELNAQKATDVFTYLIGIKHSTQPHQPTDGGVFIPALSQTKPS